MSSPSATSQHTAARCFVAGPFCWVCGTGLQIMQAALWPAWWYMALLVLALCAFLLLRRSRAPLWLLYAALAATAAFACTGWRAAQRAQLAPQLDGKTLQIIGTVAALPQRTTTGWRFLFDIEGAQFENAPLPIDEDIPQQASGGARAAPARAAEPAWL